VKRQNLLKTLAFPDPSREPKGTLISLSKRYTFQIGQKLDSGKIDRIINALQREGQSPSSGGNEFDKTPIDALILKKLTGGENATLCGKG